MTNYLNKGDCLVLNDTKVLPARLFGVKVDTGAKIEVLSIKAVGRDDRWETLIKPAKRIKVGIKYSFGNGKLTAICVKNVNMVGGC